MHEIFYEALKNYNDGDDIAPLKQLVASEKIPYQTRWLDACTDIASLKALIALFTVHARDLETHSHIFQDVLECEWDEAIDLFLAIDPNLVNIAVRVDITVREKATHGIVPLISYAMSKNLYTSTVKKLITDKLNVALLDYKHETVFHDLASNAEMSERYQELIPMLVSKAPAYVWDMRNEALDTLHDCWDFFPKGITQTHPEESITANALAYRFQGMLPSRSWIDMSLSLIGKQQKYGPEHPFAITLFFSQTFLQEYLVSLLKRNQQDFFINGILIVMKSAHSVNIVAMRKAGGPIHFLLIDCLAKNDFNSDKMKDALSPYHVPFELIVTKDAFQHADSGCRIIATYLAGRFLKPERAQQLINMIDECVATKKYELSLSDFPANLGPLLICQSLHKINTAVQTRGGTQVNKEYPNYQEKHRKGVHWLYSQEYADIEGYNKLQNHTLNRKNQNQLKHAQKAINADYRPQFAKLIGASEAIPTRSQKMVHTMIDKDMHWDQFYRAGSYQSTLFFPPAANEVAHVDKKRKIANV